MENKITVNNDEVQVKMESHDLGHGWTFIQKSNGTGVIMNVDKGICFDLNEKQMIALPDHLAWEAIRRA